MRKKPPGHVYEKKETMEEFKSQVTDIIDRTPGVKSFRFEKKESMSFRAGQYFLLTIDVAGEKRTKPFSFSSSPTEGYIEFTKRITGSDFSKALGLLGLGDLVGIKMPYGKFTLRDGDRKIALLSGGIGITPFRSICKFSSDKKLDVDIVLLYGNNTENDIIFKDDLDAMQRKNTRFRAVYTITSPEAIQRGCTCGRTGFIDECMIDEEIPDHKDRIFYVCGPPAMVDCLVNLLKNKLSIPEDKIIIEHFAGY